jgi:hypothetical protein
MLTINNSVKFIRVKMVVRLPLSGYDMYGCINRILSDLYKNVSLTKSIIDELKTHQPLVWQAVVESVYLCYACSANKELNYKKTLATLFKYGEVNKDLCIENAAALAIISEVFFRAGIVIDLSGQDIHAVGVIIQNPDKEVVKYLICEQNVAITHLNPAQLNKLLLRFKDDLQMVEYLIVDQEISLADSSDKFLEWLLKTHHECDSLIKQIAKCPQGKEAMISRLWFYLGENKASEVSRFLTLTDFELNDELLAELQSRGEFNPAFKNIYEVIAKKKQGEAAAATGWEGLSLFGDCALGAPQEWQSFSATQATTTALPTLVEECLSPGDPAELDVDSGASPARTAQVMPPEQNPSQSKTSATTALSGVLSELRQRQTAASTTSLAEPLRSTRPYIDKAVVRNIVMTALGRDNNEGAATSQMTGGERADRVLAMHRTNAVNLWNGGRS